MTARGQVVLRLATVYFHTRLAMQAERAPLATNAILPHLDTAATTRIAARGNGGHGRPAGQRRVSCQTIFDRPCAGPVSRLRRYSGSRTDRRGVWLPG